MMNEDTVRAYAPVVLRWGLAAMYLWFGMSQLAEPSLWTSWVPEWALIGGIGADTIVLLNGTFEVLAGGLLAYGLFTRPVALLLALHLVLIVFEIGLSPIGVRDFGLMAATFALALYGADRFSLLGRR